MNTHCKQSKITSIKTKFVYTNFIVCEKFNFVTSLLGIHIYSFLFK